SRRTTAVSLPTRSGDLLWGVRSPAIWSAGVWRHRTVVNFRVAIGQRVPALALGLPASAIGRTGDHEKPTLRTDAVVCGSCGIPVDRGSNWISLSNVQGRAPVFRVWRSDSRSRPIATQNFASEIPDRLVLSLRFCDGDLRASTEHVIERQTLLG